MTRRLLDEPSLASALRFGWSALAGMLAEHFWIYLAIAAAGTLLALLFDPRPNFFSHTVEGFAVFPALAAAVRFVRPEFRMDRRIVTGIFGLWALIIGIFLVVVFPLNLLARSSPIAAKFVMLIFVLLTPFVIWLAVKIVLAVPYYVLESEANRSIRDAIGESLEVVSGNFWWTIVFLSICIGLVCELVPRLLASSILSNGAEAPLAAKIFGWLIYYAGAIPRVVWLQASLVALAASARPQYLASDEVAHESA